MNKDSKGQRKLENSGGGLLPAWNDSLEYNRIGKSMNKDSKGHRKLENSGGGLLPAVEGHSLAQNRTDTMTSYLLVDQCATL